MIQANELRLGNFVTVDNEKYHPKLKNIPLQVTGMSLTSGLDDEPTYSITLNHPKEEPNSYNETYSQFLKFIQPIPLTPEILEKAGFVEIKDEGRGIGVFVNGVYDFEETILGSGDYALSIHQEYTMTKIRYVHQLQNLYYSLTGNELDIKI